MNHCGQMTKCGLWVSFDLCTLFSIRCYWYCSRLIVRWSRLNELVNMNNMIDDVRVSITSRFAAHSSPAPSHWAARPRTHEPQPQPQQHRRHQQAFAQTAAARAKSQQTATRGPARCAQTAARITTRPRRRLPQHRRQRRLRHQSCQPKGQKRSHPSCNPHAMSVRDLTGFETRTLSSDARAVFA